MTENRIMTYDYANYLNTGTEVSPVYSLMGTGFSSLGENSSPQLETKIYINEKSATKTITNYEGSFAFDTDFIKGQSAIDFIYDVFRNRKTGTDAETDYVQVELFSPIAGQSNTFKARKFRVAVEVSDRSGEGGGLQKLTGNLNDIGDFVDGTFCTTTRMFTANSTVLGVLNVISLAGQTSGKTAVTVAPAPETNNGYVYKTDVSVSMPYLDESLSSWTDWNGTDEITAVSGNELIVAEVDSSDKCKKAGKVTVVSA